MTLDGIMFDNLFFYPFVVVFMRAKVSICPHISDVVVTNEVVKGDVFEFRGRRHTKNRMM